MPSASTKKILSFSIKTMLVGASFAYLFYKLSSNDFRNMMESSQNSLFNLNHLPYLILLLLLMCVNWSIEAIKWKKLLEKTEIISFATSLKSILSGVTISLFTPNRAGEFVGKIFFLDKENKADAILLNVVGSLSQVLITFCVGLFALQHYLLNYLNYQWNQSLLLFAVLLVAAVSVYLFFNIVSISKNWTRGNFIRKIIPYSDSAINLSKPEIAQILILSLLRYAVFSFQYYLLLCAFNIATSFAETSFLIALYFFFVSLIPTYALSELGVRGSVSLVLFGLISVNSGAILATSLLLWIINLALPAIVGAYFVYQLKFFSTSKND